MGLGVWKGVGVWQWIRGVWEEYELSICLSEGSRHVARDWEGWRPWRGLGVGLGVQKGMMGTEEGWGVHRVWEGVKGSERDQGGV